ncbi:hypothetical protein JTE90_009452 [Oedothorax gibbosus]|uniref:Uncharacterized protein n=1 Tax=Oedothorax gibbosus TaxID=931172 RepID=A0AAV6VVT8_9ARAC|nr:hypothetical protein JTE90_009452 [Oedothorax gibbosus]
MDNLVLAGSRSLMVLLNRRTRLRSRILRLFMMICINVSIRSHEMWTRLRTDNWWAKIVIPMDETEWRNNFRISKSTYRFLCEKLTTLDRMDTRMRHAIRRDKRIA